MDRLDRMNRAEQLFKDIGIPYSIYNRGLYQELKEEREKQNSILEVPTETKPIIEEAIITFEEGVEIQMPKKQQQLM